MDIIKDLGPLTWNVPIVDVKSGRPTPEFQRRWETQRKNNGNVPTKFVNLSDVPQNYTGAANDLVAVRPDAQGLIFYSLSEYLDLTLDDVQGDIIYRGASGWVVLPAAIDGMVLTTHGAGANPTWELANGGDLGFGWNSTGLLVSGELLGAGIIPHNTTFDETNPDTKVICAIPATADADLQIWTTDAGGILYSPGVIHCPAGSTTPVVQFSPNPWLYLGQHPIYLYAPNPADTTLAEIMGFVVGVKT